MSLSVGIVGLPNVGKSTLFNALLAKQQAYAANFPFATIDPNIGVVPVPDVRLSKLSETVAKAMNLEGYPPEVQATIEFIDIAGLIKGAHKGEGLGNKFLSHIRETNAICHVVRGFADEDVIREGSTDPKTDLEVIETELVMADYQTLENQKSKIKKQNDNSKLKSYIDKAMAGVEKGTAVRDISFTDEELKEGKQLGLLTAKPILVVVNISEDDLSDAANIEKKFAIEMELDESQVIAISARTEEQLVDFTDFDRRDYLKDLGVESTGLERLIQKAFATLGLVTYLTAGEKEVRAWTIKKGINAQGAAGVIHSDFEKKFIKADVVSYNDFVNCGGWKASRDAGKVRSEGKDYIVKDSDVIEFKIGA